MITRAYFSHLAVAREVAFLLFQQAGNARRRKLLHLGIKTVSNSPMSRHTRIRATVDLLMR